MVATRDPQEQGIYLVSFFLVSLLSLHVPLFQTDSPSPLSKWEEEEESFDMRIVREGGGLDDKGNLRNRHSRTPRAPHAYIGAATAIHLIVLSHYNVYTPS